MRSPLSLCQERKEERKLEGGGRVKFNDLKLEEEEEEGGYIEGSFFLLSL